MSRNRQKKKGQGTASAAKRRAMSSHGRRSKPCDTLKPLAERIPPFLPPVVIPDASPLGSPGDAAGVMPSVNHLPLTLSAEAVGALSTDIAAFNRQLEELLDLQRSSARPSEDRKETWVLLSALTVVIMFCFVAFYLNQTEIREMHSDLHDDIDRASRSVALSVEEAFTNFNLDQLPEAQAALGREFRDRDERGARRIASLVEEIQRRSDGADSKLRQVDAQLAGLRQLAEQIHKLQMELRARDLLAVSNQETSKTNSTESWADRAPDGAPQDPSPESAAGPPSSNFQLTELNTKREADQPPVGPGLVGSAGG